MHPNLHRVSTTLTRDRLAEILGGVCGKRVLVIGDCMLDEYQWGRVSRVSPEAPVMVVEHERTTYAAGGASNVAANVVALDGQASIIAVVGADDAGSRLRQELERQGVCHDGLVLDADRPTTVKTRVIAHSQQVLRVDREQRSPVTPAIASQILSRAHRALPDADVVLFSDYSKGLLTAEVVDSVMRLARELGKPVFANPKPANIRNYQGLSLVSLNQSEAEAVTDINLSTFDLIETAGDRLLHLCSPGAVVVTLGGRGLVLFEAGQPWRHLPVVPLEVYDPCGCGDSAISAAALARAAGANWVEAAALANLAGNAKVRKRGVVPVTRNEIESVWAASHAMSNGHASNGARHPH